MQERRQGRLAHQTRLQKWILLLRAALTSVHGLRRQWRRLRRLQQRPPHAACKLPAVQKKAMTTDPLVDTAQPSALNYGENCAGSLRLSRTSLERCPHDLKPPRRVGERIVQT